MEDYTQETGKHSFVGMNKIKSADRIYVIQDGKIGRTTNNKQNTKLGVGKVLSKILLKWLKMQSVPFVTNDGAKCL